MDDVCDELEDGLDGSTVGVGEDGSIAFSRKEGSVGSTLRYNAQITVWNLQRNQNGCSMDVDDELVVLKMLEGACQECSSRRVFGRKNFSEDKNVEAMVPALHCTAEVD